MTTFAETLSAAVQQHQAGNLDQAERIYRQVVQTNPDQPDAHHLLGVLAYQRGRFEQAIAAISQAVTLNPTVFDYHLHLGMSHEALGQMAHAVASYRQAVQFKPDAADAHNNLANALQQQGNPSEAAFHCRQAVALRPEFPEAWTNLGNAVMDLGQLEEAAHCFRQALTINPHLDKACNNLGNVLVRQGKLDEAVRCYREALQLNPRYAVAYYNLADALRRQHQLDEARRALEQALQLEPNFVQAHTNLGLVLKELDKPDDAIRCFRQALQIQPGNAQAHNNLGLVLERQDELEAALECYQRAVQLQPDFAEALNNLGSVLLRQGHLEQALAIVQKALRLKPDLVEAHCNLGGVYLQHGQPELALASYRLALTLNPDLPDAQSNFLFCLNYYPDADPDAVFEEYRRWGQKHTPAAPPLPHGNDAKPERRLRIGYVSPDFRQHALIRYVEPVFAHHDARQVEVFCYAEVPRPDAITARLQKLAHQWRWTSPLNDQQIAQQIRDDSIDILVDLAGHTGGHRLGTFALKPAPIQATWLGYLNTTGLTTVDYRLTDEWLDPPGLPVRDTEELWRLPGGMCCFARPTDAADVTPLPALRRGHLTFGSLHSLFKLNGRVYDLWSEVLSALPKARLIMYRDTITDAAREQIRHEFGQRGVDSQRLDLRQGPCNDGYLAIYNEVDVSLDTFPATGGVTTCESLWMGVPVLSLCGARPVGRNSAAILARVGLTGWAVDSPEHFMTMAIRQGNELDELAELRSGLRARMAATLCDAERFTKGLEEAYRAMWRRWCAARVS